MVIYTKYSVLSSSSCRGSLTELMISRPQAEPPRAHPRGRIGPREPLFHGYGSVILSERRLENPGLGMSWIMKPPCFQGPRGSHLVIRLTSVLRDLLACTTLLRGEVVDSVAPRTFLLASSSATSTVLRTN